MRTLSWKEIVRASAVLRSAPLLASSSLPKVSSIASCKFNNQDVWTSQQDGWPQHLQHCHGLRVSFVFPVQSTQLPVHQKDVQYCNKQFVLLASRRCHRGICGLVRIDRILHYNVFLWGDKRAPLRPANAGLSNDRRCHDDLWILYLLDQVRWITDVQYLLMTK